MTNRSVAQVLLEAFELAMKDYGGRTADERPEVGGLSPATLVAQARDPKVPYRERDRLLELLVRQYRTGPREVWAPVLLEALAPGMARTLVRYGVVEPLIDTEDLAHELIALVLEAALAAPLPEGARWVDRRILMRAGGLLNRRVGREAHRARDIRGLDGVASTRRAYQIWRAIDRLSTYPSQRKGRNR